MSPSKSLRVLVVAAVAATTGAAVLPLADAATQKKTAKPKTLTVGVFDNYYAPIPKKAIKKGTKVRWRWDANTIDVHDVKLTKAPKGVKKFQSDPLASPATFTRALTKPGKYYFICTFHEDMKMTITVAKK